MKALGETIKHLQTNPNPSELKKVYGQIEKMLDVEFDYSKLPDGYNYPPTSSHSSTHREGPMQNNF